MSQDCKVSKRFLAIVLAVLVGGVLAGCSGGGDDGKVELKTAAPTPQDAPAGAKAPGDSRDVN
mgnify:CR=1 FL=1